MRSRKEVPQGEVRPLPPKRGSGAWGHTFASLSEPEYAWYFLGNIVFFAGMQMQFVLRGFLAFDLTNSASALALVSISIAFPMLFASPFGGVVADRVNKRTLLILTQLVAAISSLVIAVLILGGWIQFWHLLASSVFTGLVFSFNMPARQAIVPLLVPRHKLMNAISLQMGGINLTRIIAPALGGVLIVPFGIGGVFLFTAILFVLAALSELHLPKHGLSRKGKQKRFWSDFGEGFRFIFKNRTIGLLIAVGLIAPLFGFPVQQMLPVFSKDVFGMGAGGLAILASMTGVGGIVGSIIAANLDERPQKGRIMLIGGLLMGAFLVAFALTSIFWLAAVFLIASTIGQMLFMTTNNTVIQATLPSEIRGRVMSIMMMSFGLMPLGVVPIAAAADSFGSQTAVAASSTILIVSLLVLFALSASMRGLRLQNMGHIGLSPVRAAALVAEGRLTEEEAEVLLTNDLLPDDEKASDEEVARIEERLADIFR